MPGQLAKAAAVVGHDGEPVPLLPRIPPASPEPSTVGAPELSSQTAWADPPYSSANSSAAIRVGVEPLHLQFQAAPVGALGRSRVSSTGSDRQGQQHLRGSGAIRAALDEQICRRGRIVDRQQLILLGGPLVPVSGQRVRRRGPAPAASASGFRFHPDNASSRRPRGGMRRPRPPRQ